jgi:endosialidase-like protein
MRRTSLVFITALVVGFTAAEAAHASPPINDGCDSNTVNCLTATNTGTNQAIVANCAGGTNCISVAQTGNGDGVDVTTGYGFASAISGTNTNASDGAGMSGTGVIGVYGSSTASNGYGVEGSSTASDGVYGVATAGSTAGVHGYGGSTSWGVHGEVTGASTAVYGDNTSTSGWSGYFNGNVYAQNCVSVNGDPILGSCSSDARLKKNIRPLTGAVEQLLKLRPVTFEWIDAQTNAGHTSGTKKGFIAQEVEKVIPEWVSTDDRGYKTVNRDDLPVMLVASVQSLKAENDELRERVKALEAGRRPLTSGFGEGGVGVGVGLVLALGAYALSRRRLASAANA